MCGVVFDVVWVVGVLVVFFGIVFVVGYLYFVGVDDDDVVVYVYVGGEGWFVFVM